jgi:hypothetical protein
MKQLIFITILVIIFILVMIFMGCATYKPTSIEEVVNLSPPCVQQFLKDQGAVVAFTDRPASYTLPFEKRIYIKQGQSLDFSVSDLQYETGHLVYSFIYCPATKDPECKRQQWDTTASEKFAYKFTKNQECP